MSDVIKNIDTAVSQELMRIGNDIMLKIEYGHKTKKIKGLRVLKYLRAAQKHRLLRNNHDINNNLKSIKTLINGL